MAKKDLKPKDHPLTGLFVSMPVAEGTEQQPQHAGRIIGAGCRRCRGGVL